MLRATVATTRRINSIVSFAGGSPGALVCAAHRCNTVVWRAMQRIGSRAAATKMHLIARAAEGSQSHTVLAAYRYAPPFFPATNALNHPTRQPQDPRHPRLAARLTVLASDLCYLFTINYCLATSACTIRRALCNAELSRP